MPRHSRNAPDNRKKKKPIHRDDLSREHNGEWREVGVKGKLNFKDDVLYTIRACE